MLMTESYVQPLNQAVRQLFKEALRVSTRHPAMAWSVLRMIKHQRAAHARRQKMQALGLNVPPFTILSVTNTCNLKCKGCYNQAQGRPAGTRMDTELLDKILSEAEEAGSAIALLSGGEPLTHPDVLEVAARHRGMLLPLFTNGLLITGETVDWLKANRHVVPVISLEGSRTLTDDRRGAGIYAYVMDVLDQLKKAGIFYGLSLTTTTANMDIVTGGEFVQDLVGRGARLFFYVEYVPFDSTTEHLALDRVAMARLDERLALLGDLHQALFIGFPGDEHKYGGCLAAGRGFVHVSAEGALEPCPFSPFSDINLQDLPFTEALRQSYLLREIRNNHDKLTETKGGCALWENRAWVQGLVT